MGCFPWPSLALVSSWKMQGSQVPLTRDELSDLVVPGGPQQTHQGGHAPTVPNGGLVVGVPTVGEIAQCPTGPASNLRPWVVQQSHE